MKERLAMCALGAWLAGTICVTVVAAENFYTIDRLLTGPAHATFASFVDHSGRSEARDVLRYLSSELNRLYFQMWNAAQLVLGALAFWLLATSPAPPRARWGVLAMLALVVALMLWLTPQIVTIGRSLDFVARDPRPPALGRFGQLHGLYVGLEAVKLAIGAVVVYWMARPASRGGAVSAAA